MLGKVLLQDHVSLLPLSHIVNTLAYKYTMVVKGVRYKLDKHVSRE